MSVREASGGLAGIDERSAETGRLGARSEAGAGGSDLRPAAPSRVRGGQIRSERRRAGGLRYRSPISDEERLELELARGWIVRRDRQALSRIYERYFVRIYRSVFRVLGHRDRADDLTQDVFLTFMQKAEMKNISGPYSLSSYLFMKARGKARDALRQRHREQSRHEGDAVLETKAIPFGRDDVRNQDILTRRRLRAAYEELPPEHQELVRLYIAEGLNLTQIAERVGMNRSTLRNSAHWGAVIGAFRNALEAPSESS